MNHSLLD